jgi:DNA helicase-2/ATP-dependent DNA helicase PcrA
VARAAQEKVPAYVVFTDLTLQAIAEVKPADTKSMLRINGIGQSKLTKYADDVLALVSGETVDVGDRDATDDGAEGTLDEA